MVRAAPVGDVATLKVPLRCSADAGANLARVDYAVSVTADKGLAATLLGARVEAVGGHLLCPDTAATGSGGAFRLRAPPAHPHWSAAIHAAVPKPCHCCRPPLAFRLQPLPTDTRLT